MWDKGYQVRAKGESWDRWRNRNFFKKGIILGKFVDMFCFSG